MRPQVHWRVETEQPQQQFRQQPQQQQQGQQQFQQQPKQPGSRLPQNQYQQPMRNQPGQQPNYGRQQQQQQYQQQPQQQYQQQAPAQPRYAQQQRGGFQQQETAPNQTSYPTQRTPHWRPRPNQPPFQGQQQQRTNYRDFAQQNTRENPQIRNISSGGGNFRNSPSPPNLSSEGVQGLMKLATSLIQRGAPYKTDDRNNEGREYRQQRGGGHVDRRQQHRGGRRQDQRPDQRQDQRQDQRRDQRRTPPNRGTSEDQGLQKGMQPRRHKIEEQVQEEEEAQDEREEEEDEEAVEQEDEQDEQAEDLEESGEDQQEAEDEDEVAQQEEEVHITPQKRQEQKKPSVLQRQQKQISYKPISATKVQSVREEDESHGVEKCTKMCPDKQFHERFKIFREVNSQLEPLRLDSESWFGLFEIDRKTQKPSQQLTLKRFKRAAAGSGKEEQSTIVRTVEALRLTMQHILTHIVDSDNMKPEDVPFIQPIDKVNITFEQIYAFLWNRMRAMIKEISQLTPIQQRSQSIITISEQIARFFILSINQMRRFPNYDDQLNQKNLEKILAQLLQAYRESKQQLKRLMVQLKNKGKTELSTAEILHEMEQRNIYISPFEPEISGYAMVFSSKENIFQHLGNMTDDLKGLESNPILESKQMKNSLAMLEVINQRNISSYFLGIEREGVDYLLACTMLFHLNSMRKQAVTRIMKSCRDDTERSVSFSLAFVDQLLQFKNKNELVKFMGHIGAKLTMDEESLITKQALTGDDGLLYATPYYEFRQNKLNRSGRNISTGKRLIASNELSREEIMRGLSSPPSNYDRVLIQECKKFFWERRGQEEEVGPFLDIEDRPKSIGGRDSPSKQNKAKKTEQLSVILGRIKKKTQKQKFMDELKDKLIVFFKKGFDKKREQRSKLNRLFQIIEANMDNQEELGFHRIHTISEERKLLLKFSHRLQENTKLSRLFTEELEVPDQYFLFSEKHYYQEVQQKTDADAVLRFNNILQATESIDSFEQRHWLVGFFKSLCQLYMELPKERLARQRNFTLRIMVPIEQGLLNNKQARGALVSLVNYLTRRRGVSHFLDFIADKQTEATFEEGLSFKTGSKKDIRNVDILLQLQYYRVKSEKELQAWLDEQYYGASLLIVPILAKDSAKSGLLAQTIGRLDANLWKIPVVVMRLSEQDNPPKDNFAPPLVRATRIADQNLFSLGLDCQAKQSVLDMLRSSIMEAPLYEPVGRSSLSRFLGEMRLNMKYLQQQVRRPTLRILYYQQYINMCFQCLRDAVTSVFEKRHSIPTWAEEIWTLQQKPNAPGQATPLRKESITAVTKKEMDFLTNLFSHLKMNLITVKYLRSINKMDVFLCRLVSYLRPLLGGGMATTKKTLRRLRNKLQRYCTINHDQLPDGDIARLFSCLLNAILETLCMNCDDIQLIVPDSFRFRVSSEQLELAVQRKYDSLLKRLTKVKAVTPARQLLLKKLTKRREPLRQILAVDCYVYARQDMFDEYVKRVENHKHQLLDVTSQSQ